MHCRLDLAMQRKIDTVIKAPSAKVTKIWLVRAQ